MASSDSGQGSGIMDCSVGSIVWVRRRNGSWWPGKILGTEELSASHLMSPRSGTPVKLLGREDASVDWYNLEKSKRVKAFRCGEFDDCIERAESSQGIPPKKREKYARREDAILHALELEKQQGKLVIAPDPIGANSSIAVKKESITFSPILRIDNGKPAKPNTHRPSKKPDPSLEPDGSGTTQKPKDTSNHLGWEEDNSEATPRMRGLQDFGLRIAPQKQKLSSLSPNGSRKPVVNHSPAVPSSGVGTGNTTNPLKRSREGFGDEPIVKRRDRRRPLVQVLRKSPVTLSVPPDSVAVPHSVVVKEETGAIYRAKRSTCVYSPPGSGDCLDYKEVPSSLMEISPSSQVGEENLCPRSASLNEEHESESMEETETDSSETDSMNSDTDEEMAAVSDDAEPTGAERKAFALSEAHTEQESTSDDEDPDESAAYAAYTPHLYPRHSVGVSEWQLKGKRNTRNLSKRPVDLGRSTSYYTRHDDFIDGYDEPILIENDFRTRNVAFGSRKYLASRNASRGHNSMSVGNNMMDWDDLSWEDQPQPRGYLDDNLDYFLASRPTSRLIDVELKVQATYQREHVPIVSLMSRLNGKAIIGHPIQIEPLEDGFSETLLPTTDGLDNEPSDDGASTLQPMWRTARRTANFRVPRPRYPTSSDGPNTRATKIAVPHIPRPPDRKLIRKPPKKASYSSSQKTRTLSSIPVEQKLGNKVKDSSKSDFIIKPESGPTTVACIPLKLVFSRLHEAVSRTPARIERNPL